MSACCIAAAVLMTAQSAYIESEAVFGSSITDTEDIEIYIDVNKDRKNISKYIYGLNDIYNMSDVTVNSTKQSGAELSSYNWETNYANLAADGAYENSISLVSGYSRTHPTEDRAEIFENLMKCYFAEDSGSEMFDSCPHLRQKAEEYAKILRKYFKSCSDAKELSWEKYLLSSKDQSSN